MSVNYEFEIDAREVFQALRETKRLPPSINGAQVDTTDDDTGVNFLFEGTAPDIIKIAVYLP